MNEREKRERRNDEFMIINTLKSSEKNQTTFLDLKFLDMFIKNRL